MKKQTIAINTPYVRRDAYGSLAVPIYSNVAFEFDDAAEMADAFCNRIKAPDYARIANPTVTNLEQRVKALTGAAHVTAFNSGMAAISNVLLAVVAQGRNIVTSRHLFGNNNSNMAQIAKTLIDLIGNTPLLELTGTEKELGLKAQVVAKLECLNPLRSVKDRTALAGGVGFHRGHQGLPAHTHDARCHVGGTAYPAEIAGGRTGAHAGS